LKTAAVRPAQIRWAADGALHAPEHGDIALTASAALARARHVYVDGNQLPARWAGREHFTVLDTGFALGHNFIATWDAWKNDPARCRWLHCVAIEENPPSQADLARAHAGSPLNDLAQVLAQAWPPMTPNLHALEFEGGRVRLLLAWGRLAALVHELRCTADAFCIDPRAAWCSAALMKSLARRAAHGATATSTDLSPELGQALTAAGFTVAHAPASTHGPAFTHARWQPRFAPRGMRLPAPRPAADAVVVGAGLAGAFAASALHALGWQVRVLDRHARPAQEASGNPAGVFHGTVHGDDSTHARLLRAAALQAQRSLHPLLRQGTVAGQADGLLRVQSGGLTAMQSVLAAQGQPADYVQALDCEQASQRAGLALTGPAWFFPGGGWLAPRDLVKHLMRPLAFAGPGPVAALRPVGDRWQLLAADGRVLAEAAAVVLANAHQAGPLLAPWGAAAWRLQRARGQLTRWQGSSGGLALPLAGDGYALPWPAALGGGVLCGATSSVDDDEPAERAADHDFNLHRLARLCRLAPPVGAVLQGRVAWRVQADDRLPVAGPLALPASAGTRSDQARLLARREGLFVCTALGGRGITLAPLLGAVVAAQVAGTPLTLEQGLLDAIDPGRWLVRAARRE
jgi:tRNA 5-methylaminomethyl-2-thiouridine biosynthesis bifunctional protein